MSSLPSDLIPSGFSTKTLNAFLFSMRDICPVHLILLGLIRSEKHAVLYDSALTHCAGALLTLSWRLSLSTVVFTLCDPMFQARDGTSRMEIGNISPIAGAAEPLTPTPPPPFDHHQAYKFITTAPPRDTSPPPSYDEAVRAMMVMAASTPGDQHRTPVSPDCVPEPSQYQSANVAPSIPASLTPRTYPSTTIALSSSALPQPTALKPEQESSPLIQTASALVHPTQPALTQICETAITSSTPSCTPSQQMEEVLWKRKAYCLTWVAHLSGTGASQCTSRNENVNS
jgi:hypothetical protein